MQLLGTVALGWMWLRWPRSPQAAADDPFYAAKLVTARYYAERWLPDARRLRRKIEAGAETLMALTPEAFRARSERYGQTANTAVADRSAGAAARAVRALRA